MARKSLRILQCKVVNLMFTKNDASDWNYKSVQNIDDWHPLARVRITCRTQMCDIMISQFSWIQQFWKPPQKNPFFFFLYFFYNLTNSCSELAKHFVNRSGYQSACLTTLQASTFAQIIHTSLLHSLSVSDLTYWLAWRIMFLVSLLWHK